MIELDDQQSDARAWFESLRDRICAEFEAIEDEYAGARPDEGPAGRFERKEWERPGGGGLVHHAAVAFAVVVRRKRPAAVVARQRQAFVLRVFVDGVRTYNGRHLGPSRGRYGRRQQVVLDVRAGRPGMSNFL